MVESAAVRQVIEQHWIADVINTVFMATDSREWERVRRCFAARVTFDMTSLAGRVPTELSPEQIARAGNAV